MKNYYRSGKITLIKRITIVDSDNKKQ